MTSQSTSPAMNAELVRAGFQAFNSGDVGRCLALAAPDLITNLAELPGPQLGRDAWQQGFEMMKHAFPDGGFAETDQGFAAAFYADFAPAQAAAIRRAVDLMSQARRS